MNDDLDYMIIRTDPTIPELGGVIIKNVMFFKRNKTSFECEVLQGVNVRPGDMLTISFGHPRTNLEQEMIK